MSGLIGKKIGMTSIFDESGKNIPCTVIEAGPCIVTQVRSEAIDGYHAIQLGFDEKTEKSATRAHKGHTKKAGTTPKKNKTLQLSIGKSVFTNGIMFKLNVDIGRTKVARIAAKINPKPHPLCTIPTTLPLCCLGQLSATRISPDAHSPPIPKPNKNLHTTKNQISGANAESIVNKE